MTNDLIFNFILMNKPREQSSASMGKKEFAVMLAVLAGLSAVLEPKNPLDPTGQTGFQLRGTGTTALVDREATKQEVTVKNNFGQDAGW